MSYQVPYDWQRDGNCLWATCPECEFQFPITLTLAERLDVLRCCPRCHNDIKATGNTEGEK